MIEFITLENYRNVKQKRNFIIKPITILIGPNNSGKSSLIKSLLLLKDNRYDFENLNFQKGPHKLGNFDSVLSKGSLNNTLEFALPIFFIGAAIIKIRYENRKNEISNGRLIDLSIIRNHDSTELMKITNVKYFKDTNELDRFQFQINYIAFYNYFKDQKAINNNDVFLSEFFKERYFDQPNTQYDFNKPIYELTVNSGIILSEDIIKKYLTLLSSNREITTNHDDYLKTDSMIFTALLDEIKNDFRGDHLSISGIKEDFKGENGIKYIKPTQNGILFFGNIIEIIKSSLDELAMHLDKISYISSNFTIQERLHIDNINNPLTNILTRNKEAVLEKEKAFLTNWMREFQLISTSETIEIDRIAEVAFEISIKNMNTNEKTNLADCGFGLSQILTLLGEFSTSKYKTQYLLEEPEANLHPALQSKLADLFCALIPNKNFIIETHSEYMVRKFQYLVAKGELKTNDIIIHYFWKENNESKCKQIEILPSGILSNSFENGFYDEAISLQFELLKLIKAQSN